MQARMKRRLTSLLLNTAFKTNFNGASGGVRLFVDENGVAAVDLNNTLSGINNGVVDWTIEITDGEIFWKLWELLRPIAEKLQQVI